MVESVNESVKNSDSSLANHEVDNSKRDRQAGVNRTSSNSQTGDKQRGHWI